jgi:hypothetical protein
MLNQKQIRDLGAIFAGFSPDDMEQVASLANVYAHANQVNKMAKMSKAAKTKLAPLRKSTSGKSMADHYGIPLGTPLNRGR